MLSLLVCSQAAHVHEVEQLRCEKDQLQQHLQQVQCAQQQAAQQAQQERAARLLSEQHNRSMQRELQSLRQLAESITQQLQGPQQLLIPSTNTSSSQQLACAAETAAAARQSSCSAAHSFLAECRQLRQQLSSAVASSSMPAGFAGATSSGEGVHGQQRQAAADEQPQQPQQRPMQADLLHELGFGDAAATAVLAGDPVQQLRTAVLGLDSRGPAAAAAFCGQCGVAAASQERLRQSYQHMLRQVQARYQQELRQNELQHQQVRTGWDQTAGVCCQAFLKPGARQTCASTHGCTSTGCLVRDNVVSQVGGHTAPYCCCCRMPKANSATPN